LFFGFINVLREGGGDYEQKHLNMQKSKNSKEVVK